MTDRVRAALQRLRDAAADGTLRTWCDERGIDLFVVHGSALTDKPEPRDLDVALRFTEYDSADLIGTVTDLMHLAELDEVDPMVLNRAGCVAREQALVYGEPLVEVVPDSFAREQIRASMERLDTDWMRWLDIALMAGGR